MEQQLMLIEKNGILYTVLQNEFEAKDVFVQRMWYVASQQPNTVIEYDRAVLESNVWSNIQYLRCTYNSDDQERIVKLADKMFEEE